MAITASEARKNLFPLIKQVNDDRTPIEITSKRRDAVLMSQADYNALEETAHLLRSPAKVRRLLESLAQDRRLVASHHRRTQTRLPRRRRGSSYFAGPLSLRLTAISRKNCLSSGR